MITLAFSCSAQSNFSWESGKLILDNGAIKRTIVFDQKNQTIETVSVFHGDNEENFIAEKTSLEFSFTINDKTYTGQDKWNYVNHIPVSDNKQGKGVTVTVRGVGEISMLEVDITYMLYPNLSVIRKNLSFRNNSDIEMKLESLDIENIRLSWAPVSSCVYANYARQQHFGTYIGDWDDPLVVVHDYDGHKGIALGNEAPGVTKRTTYHDLYENVSIGLTHIEQDYGFRKWLQPGKEWVSSKVFIATYDGTTNYSDVINSTVNDFTRRHMGIRLMELKEKPVFVYNTWYPFRHNIDEQLIRELTDAAAECGIEEFIIDDGWQQNANPDPGRGGPNGDWLINETKFPNGLSPVFNYMKEKGMKPGLWMSIGSTHESAQVFTDHKEWFVLDKEGKSANLHTDWEVGLHTACFSTDWPEYIKSKLLGLVKNHGLEYTKLDFAIVTSAYVVDPKRSGCYATNHPYHKDQNESFLNNYRSLLNMFDDLHEEAPNLFIDCTFETVGKLQLIDYATVKHAEGDWLSNYEEPSPHGALRVRNLAWWRTPVIPAGACVIGNLPLDSKDLEFDFLSTIGTLPIMLGDPRELSGSKKMMLKNWSDWLREMQNTYDYMAYRQDLYCFGEPKEGHWDGWSRINTDSQKGGIVGVFRQGAVENSRLVTINWLEPNQKYAVISAVNKEVIGEMTGKQLKTEGFRVSMEKLYQGKLFEIKMIN